MQPFGLILILVGGFCAAGGAFDWDFVFEGREVRSYVALLVNGARHQPRINRGSTMHQPAIDLADAVGAGDGETPAELLLAA
jgi:hypothetical protein